MVMDGLVVASEALASGALLTRQRLRADYVKLHRDVYAPRELVLTARHRAIAGWLWSRREAVLVGNSAAAMLGAKWMSAAEPVELGRVQRRGGPAISERYPKASGIRRVRAALDMVDAGAESPRETRLRLVLVRGGLPPVTTQIPVADDRGRVVRRIDMGWPNWMVGVEYDGEQHFTTPARYANDIDRLKFIAAKDGSSFA